ncbi:hypothetical protein FRACA_450015 [Frankia canadensis]|uniref:Resolvase/invertase-type recombinase catalytic domain-containing protein n=1 Tax=Frankia canadensis TaxID=1836972 RepID=A0A2I2KXJ8_9ACTN|nr:hypothetical protein FRACA_450015 [Frankia canadensis]SOU57674.1 hypothetical protein FRACA_450015 [Frankia canadensis]
MGTKVGSALNGHRRKFLALLRDPRVTTIVVEHRDRFARFGAECVEAALAASGRRLLVQLTAAAPLTAAVRTGVGRWSDSRAAQRSRSGHADRDRGAGDVRRVSTWRRRRSPPGSTRGSGACGW